MRLECNFVSVRIFSFGTFEVKSLFSHTEFHGAHGRRTLCGVCDGGAGHCLPCCCWWRSETATHGRTANPWPALRGLWSSRVPCLVRRQEPPPVLYSDTAHWRDSNAADVTAPFWTLLVARTKQKSARAPPWHSARTATTPFRSRRDDALWRPCLSVCLPACTSFSRYAVSVISLAARF